MGLSTGSMIYPVDLKASGYFYTVSLIEPEGKVDSCLGYVRYTVGAIVEGLEDTP